MIKSGSRSIEIQRLPLALDRIRNVSGYKAAVAYSLRKLRNNYSGPAINVRRSSDNAAQDIGFTSNGDLDLGAIFSFVGANSGFVTTWYDQSGNGRNATQGTAGSQPRIVNAGTLDTQNSKSAVFYGGSHSLQNATMTGGLTGAPLSAFMTATISGNLAGVSRFVSVLKSGDASDFSASTASAILFYAGSSNQLVNDCNGQEARTTNAFTSGVSFQAATFHDTSTNLFIDINRTGLITKTAAPMALAVDNLYLGCGFTSSAVSNFLTGYMQELVLFNQYLLNTRGVIELNQKNYWGTP